MHSAISRELEKKKRKGKPTWRLKQEKGMNKNKLADVDTIVDEDSDKFEKHFIMRIRGYLFNLTELLFFDSTTFWC